MNYPEVCNKVRKTELTEQEKEIIGEGILRIIRDFPTQHKGNKIMLAAVFSELSVQAARDKELIIDGIVEESEK